MEKEFLVISDGTFSFTETENPNQFYFYRNDGKSLEDIEHEPMEFYHEYIIQKMMNGEIKDIVAHNIYHEMSKDKTCIRMTICDVGKKISKNKNSEVSNKQPNFFVRLFRKIFG